MFYVRWVIQARPGSREPVGGTLQEVGMLHNVIINGSIDLKNRKSYMEHETNKCSISLVRKLERAFVLRTSLKIVPT